jgi:hypothetical protein
MAASMKPRRMRGERFGRAALVIGEQLRIDLPFESRTPDICVAAAPVACEPDPGS